jgi:hypothetical protein
MIPADSGARESGALSQTWQVTASLRLGAHRWNAAQLLPRREDLEQRPRRGARVERASRAGGPGQRSHRTGKARSTRGCRFRRERASSSRSSRAGSSRGGRPRPIARSPRALRSSGARVDAGGRRIGRSKERRRSSHDGIARTARAQRAGDFAGTPPPEPTGAAKRACPWWARLRRTAPRAEFPLDEHFFHAPGRRAL